MQISKHFITWLLNEEGVSSTASSSQLAIDRSLHFGLDLGRECGADCQAANIMFKQDFDQTIHVCNGERHSRQGHNATCRLDEQAIGGVFQSERVVVMDLRPAAFDDAPSYFFRFRDSLEPILCQSAFNKGCIKDD